MGMDEILIHESFALCSKSTAVMKTYKEKIKITLDFKYKMEIPLDKKTKNHKPALMQGS